MCNIVSKFQFAVSYFHVPNLFFLLFWYIKKLMKVLKERPKKGKFEIPNHLFLQHIDVSTETNYTGNKNANTTVLYSTLNMLKPLKTIRSFIAVLDYSLTLSMTYNWTLPTPDTVTVTCAG